MKINQDYDISVIQFLQSIYNMFKVGNPDLLGINMNVIYNNGMYVRIYRKQDYYVTMEGYKTSQYQWDGEYYINIIRTVLEYICPFHSISLRLRLCLLCLPHLLRIFLHLSLNLFP